MRNKKIVCDHNIDLVRLTEVSKHWRKLNYAQTIWGATSSWKEYHIVRVSQNKTKPAMETEHLIGGTSMVDFGNMVFRISDQRSDNRKLGCWGHISIKGKHNITTTIFTYYYPCRSKLPDSTGSQ